MVINGIEENKTGKENGEEGGATCFSRMSRESGVGKCHLNDN